MKIALAGAALVSVFAFGAQHGPATAKAAPAKHGGAQAQLTADQALKRLMDGNRRFVLHKERHPDSSIPWRKQLASSGQHPFAVILGCADSRVPPELILDQGLGDIFVIRDAGNVVDDEVIGSIEYAVEHFGVPLIMVLGHEKCGAVTAAVEGGEAPGRIKTVVESIQPAVQAARKEQGDLVHNCIIANARRVAAQIRAADPLINSKVQAGAVKVVAADYDLETGKVILLKD